MNFHKKVLLIIVFLLFFLSSISQTHFWVKEVYSDSTALLKDICVDSLGNSYATGIFKDSLIIENKTLLRKSTACNNDIFIAKF
ncbi:MAG: hypothetical protein HUU47_10915, partial [Bacteroidetes bacterium]|nr:hypothetical protein [Bacteroidota bacterium]